MTVAASRGSTPIHDDVIALVFALIDVDAVANLRPRVSDAAAQLLDLVDTFPAACRSEWLVMVDIWFPEYDPSTAVVRELAERVQHRRDLIARLCA